MLITHAKVRIGKKVSSLHQLRKQIRQLAASLESLIHRVVFPLLFRKGPLSPFKHFLLIHVIRRKLVPPCPPLKLHQVIRGLFALCFFLIPYDDSIQ